LKITVHDACLSRLPCGPRQEPPEAREDGDGELQSRKLVSGEQRVGSKIPLPIQIKTNT
jgi:hypothetical protein